MSSPSPVAFGMKSFCFSVEKIISRWLVQLCALCVCVCVCVYVYVCVLHHHWMGVHICACVCVCVCAHTYRLDKRQRDTSHNLLPICSISPRPLLLVLCLGLMITAICLR